MFNFKYKEQIKKETYSMLLFFWFLNLHFKGFNYFTGLSALAC